jgi:putative ABC transport system permease protein
MLLLRLALRNVFRHRGRSAVTLAALALGVAGLMLVGGFVNDLVFQLGESVIRSQTGHLQIQKSGYFESGARSPGTYSIKGAEALAASIRRVAHVTTVAARVDFSGLLNNGRTDWAVIGSGVEPDNEARLGTYTRLVVGRRLAANESDSVVVGSGVASALGVSPGDTVTVLVTSREGALNSLDFRVVGVSQSFSREFDSRAVTIPLAAARELLRSDEVNTLVVGLDDTASTEAARRAIERVLPAGLVVKTWQELNDFYRKTVALYRQQFAVLELIVLALILLSVANAVNMTAHERTGEFGTMLALGNTHRRIVASFLAESLLLGLVGTAVGVLLAVAASAAVQVVGIPMPPPPNSDLGYTAHIRLTPVIASTAAGIGVAAASAAGLLQARGLFRLSPAAALRANA